MKKSFFFILFSMVYGILSAQVVADFKFTSQKLVLNSPSGNIYGTLTIPESTKKLPVVLIVPGSGVTDRDGNSESVGVKNNCYKLIAEDLARKGIASLRYDKNGVGKSMRSVTGPALLIEDYIEDAKAWISFLEQSHDYSRIIVLGHGEGSLVGMIAARKTGANAFISVEGAGMPYGDILLYGLKSAPKNMQVEAKKIVDDLNSDIRVDSVSPELTAIFDPSIQPFIKSILKYNPAKEFSKLQIPALILHGSYDLFVPVENANLLSKAKPDAQLKIIKNMNYILKDADEDEAYNQATYFKPYLPLNIECMKSMIGFIQSL